MIGFIVWTRKFVEFGDKTNDVMTKQKTWKINYFDVFSIGHHLIFQNYEIHFFHAQAKCVLKCAVKVELTAGDMQFSDPLAITRVIYFVETLLSVLETSILYQKWPVYRIVS